MLNKVIVQKWLESERGWGTRPDGYSLHLTEADRKAFCNNYWKEQKAGFPTPPDEYSRQDGTPYEAFVDDETYNRVKANPHGARFYGEPPGSGGTDGWLKNIPIHQ